MERRKLRMLRMINYIRRKLCQKAGLCEICGDQKPSFSIGGAEVCMDCRPQAVDLLNLTLKEGEGKKDA